VIDLALEQNLELKVKEQEIAIKFEIANGANWKILPQLIFTGEQSGRNQNTGSFSQSLTNQPPAPPSISSTQNITRWDFTMTWNILDFGLSYLRFRQEANKTLMAEFEYARLSQNLVLEVTRNYWKTILAQNGVKRSESLLAKVDAYQNSLRKMASEHVIAAGDALKNDGQMVKLKLKLQDFKRDFITAKSALAQSMGIADSQSFELAAIEEIIPPIADFDYEELENIALLSRPELFQRDVEVKVFRDELRIQTLQLLPPIAPYSSAYHDGNKFLIYNYWLQAGLKVSYDLFALPRTYSGMCAARLQETLVKKNRIAMALAVITQLNLALIIYDDARDYYLTAKEYKDIQRKLYDQSVKSEEVGLFHSGDVLGFETEAFLAEMTALETYGNLKLAEAQINNALGRPFYTNQEWGD
jgi:outer membrane protein TolC